MSVPGIISPLSNSLPSGGISPFEPSALMSASISPLSFPLGPAIPAKSLSALTGTPQTDDFSSVFQQIIQLILLLFMQFLSVPNLDKTVQADGSDENLNRASAKQQDADNDTDAENGDGCNGD